MATVSRSTKVSGGTTLQASTLARAVDVETDMLTLFSAHNNHDAGTSKWTIVSALNATNCPLVADNSSGSNDVAQFKVNGTTKVNVTGTGNLNLASTKVTGMANGTAATDAVAFGQIKYLQAPVMGTGTTGTTASSTGFVDAVPLATITPTSASSRIKITVQVEALVVSSGDGVYLGLKRASTDLHATGFISAFAVAANQRVALSFSYIDSPATTSATTYTLRSRSNGGGSYTINDLATLWVMILEEVA